MAAKIEIKGQDGEVMIDVLEYENLFASNDSDINWLECQVIVKVGTFACDISCSFSSHDFTRFRDELRELIAYKSEHASFVTDENCLHLNVGLMSTGAIIVNGVAGMFGPPKASLSFSFETERIYLAQTLHDLNNSVEGFPIKNIADDKDYV